MTELEEEMDKIVKSMNKVLKDASPEIKNQIKKSIDFSSQNKEVQSMLSNMLKKINL